MEQKISYRKQLLLAVEAFLEADQDSMERGHQMIRLGLEELSHEEEPMTLNWLLWYKFFNALSDYAFFASRGYLQEISHFLQGKQPQPLMRYIYQYDFRAEFTDRDHTWYRQLEEMLSFLHAIPFSELHQFFSPATQKQEEPVETLKRVPQEIMDQINQIQTEYEQRTLGLEQLCQEHPLAEDVGQEKMSLVIFQLVTSLLTGLYVGWQAVYSGYPAIWKATIGGTLFSERLELVNVDAAEDLLRAQHLLSALAGQRPLFFSWSVYKVSSLDSDAFLFDLQ